MTSTRLDLKYRPRKFSDVLGNDGVVRLLIRRSQTNTLTDQSMLFGGPKGTGKTTLARIVAMAVTCRNKQDAEPCGVCDGCVQIINGISSYVDEMDAASQGTVDRIRNIVEDSEYETVDGTNNVYILDEAQRLSPAAQDAMLKAIENRSITVIMCTTEPHKIRASIRSRVEEYPISPPSTDVVVSRLEKICNVECIQYDTDALKLLSRSCQNCPRTSIRAIETISILGPISIQAVQEFFHFDSYGIIDKILANIDTNPGFAIQAFDGLIDTEGVSWVRDAMLFAISSGLRSDVGIKHSYPCKLTFFQTRLQYWSEFARQIGMLERPTAAGILSALISTKSGGPTIPAPILVPVPVPSCSVPVPAPSPNPPQVVAPKPNQTVPDAKESPKQVDKPKTITIDGVSFSSKENLTSLDGKIGPSEPPKTQDGESRIVEYRSDMEPISDREFSRDFISRIGRK